MTTAGAIEATSTQLPLAMLCRDLRQFRGSASEPVIDDIRITLPESSRNDHFSICRKTRAKQLLPLRQARRMHTKETAVRGIGPPRTQLADFNPPIPSGPRGS